jgi:hypothetical protein
VGKKGIDHSKADIIYVSMSASRTSRGPSSIRRSSRPATSPTATIGIQLKSFDVSPQVTKPGAQARCRRHCRHAGQRRQGHQELRRQGSPGVIGSQIFTDPNSIDLFGRDADG